MSSYLNIYLRVRSDLYEVKRINSSDYHKQHDVVLFDSYSRNSKLYQTMNEHINPVWAGDEEKYTILTKENISYCIEKCREFIEYLKDTLNCYNAKREEYIKYLQGLPKVLSYDEFRKSTSTDEDNYILETKEELEEYEYCLSQLQLISNLVENCSIKCNGFSEVLCNID